MLRAVTCEDQNSHFPLEIREDQLIFQPNCIHCLCIMQTHNLTLLRLMKDKDQCLLDSVMLALQIPSPSGISHGFLCIKHTMHVCTHHNKNV